MYTFMDKIGGGGGVGGLLLGRRNGLGEWEGCSNLVGDWYSLFGIEYGEILRLSFDKNEDW